MKKVILFDKSILYIEDDQVAGLERKLAGTAPFWLNHSGGRDFLRPQSVLRITNGGADAPRKIPESHRLPPPPETPEQKAKIEATKARIRKMFEEKKKLAKDKGVK